MAVPPPGRRINDIWNIFSRLVVEHETFPPLELSTNTGIFMFSCWVLFVEISLFIPLCLLIKSVVPPTNLLLTTNAGAQRTNWQYWQCQSQQTHQVPVVASENWNCGEITTTIQLYLVIAGSVANCLTFPFILWVLSYLVPLNLKLSFEKNN